MTINYEGPFECIDSGECSPAPICPACEEGVHPDCCGLIATAPDIPCFCGCRDGGRPVRRGETI